MKIPFSIDSALEVITTFFLVFAVVIAAAILLVLFGVAFAYAVVTTEPMTVDHNREQAITYNRLAEQDY